MTSTEAESCAARWLLTPEAIRVQCGKVFDAGRRGELAHFTYCPENLDGCADFVVETIRQNYPEGEIPYHARWRHFVTGGRDCWRELADAADLQGIERARSAMDLAVVSVLLDAGAGDQWCYEDRRGGKMLSRSEGLAIASLDAFAAGLFSSHPDQPLRADAEGLATLSRSDLADAFQVTADNPLAGLEGRVALMSRLGEACCADANHFGNEGRIGNLADHYLGLTADGGIGASQILIVLLHALSPIWPGRLELAGINLGDTWRHPAAIGKGDASDGLVPFHKLSQWLSYSMVEPLQELGLQVTDLDDLTGLAEYRNGGLFVDAGVIVPRDQRVFDTAHDPGSELIVEWRALTICLLDEIAELVRKKLDKTPSELPLASVLEGGTWAAGRRIAAQKRPGGGPPIAIVSDGSVF